MRIASPLVSGLAYLTSILALPAVRTDWRNDCVSSLDQCPALSHKAPATSVDDLRPDEISVIMALGDSITAGLFARPAEPENAHLISGHHEKEKTFMLPGLSGFQEYRGKSFSTGGDVGSVTLAGSIRIYNKDLKGQSHGHHRPGIFGGLSNLGHTPDNDGLNAAVSGAKAIDLANQVTSYLLPGIDQLDVKPQEWKLMTLSIGANDVCDYCLAGNGSIGGAGSPQKFAGDVREALILARDNIPNLIVDLVGLFQVSAIYNLSREEPTCTPLRLPPIFPTLPIECQCAWAPGPLGDAVRRKMDALGEEYNAALKEVVDDLNAEKRAGFMIVWQPGTFLALADFPTIALSPIDCFHPSAEAHKRIGAGLWNRLTLSGKEKGRPMVWEEIDRLRCLKDDDRIRS